MLGNKSLLRSFSALAQDDGLSESALARYFNFHLVSSYMKSSGEGIIISLLYSSTTSVISVSVLHMNAGTKLRNFDAV